MLMHRILILATMILGVCTAASAKPPQPPQIVPCPCGIGCTITTMTSSVYSGTSGCDCVIGTGSNDTIRTYGGNDGVCARGGNDTIYGGSGYDELQGEDGADTIYGESGGDHIFGGSGNDRAFGGSGTDYISGDGGDDCLDGGLNTGDTLNGGAGYDICIRTEYWTGCEIGLGSC